MRYVFVVLRFPILELNPGVCNRKEQLTVQTFIAKLSIEAFDVSFFDRLARSNEVELHASVGPLTQRLTSLSSIVDRGQDMGGGRA